MIDSTPLSEQIEKALKEEILAGSLAPGQRISIQELASKWGISSTPIRDAIRRLEKVGFLKVAPRSGVYVATMDKRTFKDIFELRIALECLAAETATQRLPQAELDHLAEIFTAAKKHFEETGSIDLLAKNDHKIHDAIIRHSDNEKLIQIIGDLSDLITWSRLTVVERQPDSYIIALTEHLEIIEALQLRDAPRTVAALKRHLRDTLRRTLELFNE